MFIPGLLQALFGEIVQGWAQELVVIESLNALKVLVTNRDAFVVSLTASNRFVNAMGSQLFAASTTDYIASLFAPNITSVGGIKVC